VVGDETLSRFPEERSKVSNCPGSENIST